MFNDKSKRYMTKTINKTVHSEIQMILWGLIDEQREKDLELDYLQVFELKVQQGKQYIIHRQEVPERKCEWVYQLKHTSPIDQMVWSKGIRNQDQLRLI